MPDESWRIPEDADDWECNWESAARFQLRYFRALPMIEKILAVEEMCRLARTLAAGRPPRPDDDPALDGDTPLLK